jgi:predicted RNA binding protein with dsRBD fold (UPF0201 family)/dephospho-CoA kinase
LLVIGFLGFPGSGKSEATSIAVAKGFLPVVMGDAVRSLMREQGIELSEKNVGITANQLREKHGMDAIAKMCIPTVRSLSPQNVVIDGLRGIAEVAAFYKELTNDFIVIAISARSETRFQRVRARGRPDDASSLEQFKEKDERELAWGLDAALAAANYCVQNDGRLNEFKTAVSDLLERLVRTTLESDFKISIETRIYKTESQEKVECAIRNIFPDAVLTRSGDCINGKSSTLETFATLLRAQRIRATAKTELMKGLASDSFRFALNKQVALIGKVNFSQDSLGPIFVQVEARAPSELIDAITDQNLK